jgi:hypothetical protein
MKICTTCNQSKTLDNFDFRNKAKNKRRGSCKKCLKEYYRLRYKKVGKVKEQINARGKRWREYLYKFVNRYKRLVGCSKCKDKRDYVLEFHHVRDKKTEICRAISRDFSMSNLKEEMRKCVVLCANCHKELHYLERCGTQED